MDNGEFEAKYDTLSSDDMSRVGQAIDMPEKKEPVSERVEKYYRQYEAYKAVYAMN